MNISREEHNEPRGSLAGRLLTFDARMCFWIVVGFALATVPQVYIDPLLTSHVGYGARNYPLAPWLIPIAIGLGLSTWAALKKSTTFRFWMILIPFGIACAASTGIFLPELPHGNLMFIWTLWTGIGGVAVWMHD